MFIDEVQLRLKAGNGGNGAIAWRREKSVPNGGPYGGNGGNGGSIILRADENMNTLSDYRHLTVIRAQEGEKGGNKEMAGKNAEDTILSVPVGTLVREAESGKLLFDLSRHGELALICRGGRGGYGNAHFASSTRQAPGFAELGDMGDEKTVHMELKLVADIGIIGFPNAGKSTLISTLTNVRPKIADYAFTTLIPNLGVMEYRDRSFVIEDVPGLIEGASEGKGLGHTFLKHVERAKALVHLIAIDEMDVMLQNYQIIRKELKNFSGTLTKKQELVVVSKTDSADSEHAQFLARELSQALGGTRVIAISSLDRSGLDELREAIFQLIPQEEPAQEPLDERVIYDLKNQRDETTWRIREDSQGNYILESQRIEQIVRMTDMKNPEGVDRVYDVLVKQKISKDLIERFSRTSGIDEMRLGFFEGSEDQSFPKLFIAGRSFSLEAMLMRSIDRD